MSHEMRSQPLIRLDPSDPLPPYAQIRSQIAGWIASSHLQAGEPLPSVRQLARDLDIAPNTVVRAYEELEHEGWIVAVPRKGFAVAAVSAALSDEERQRLLSIGVADLVRLAWRLHVDASALHAELDRQMGLHDHE
jgi:GntR family transcriptional regulator